MQRQKDESIQSRVYTYGCVPARIAPVLNEEGAQAQLRLAGRLWNTLVAIDRARIARYRAVMRDETQERIDVLREQLAALRTELQRRRKEKRARKVDASDLTGPIEETRGQLAELITHQKATLAARHDARRAELTQLRERTNQRIKRARQAASSMGLFWGTYNEIVQRADAGRKHGGELHFRGFRGQGTLTAQIMGGASVDSCIGGQHTFFHLEPAVPGRKWRYARMRIGSEEDRSPVWLGIPIVYHRDVPADATIKSVSMTRRVIGSAVRWQLNITVNVPKVAPVPSRGRVIAIDIGWRVLPDGLRVAYWLDHAGEQGQVLVPPRDISQFDQIRNLRSICDRSMNDLLPALAAWFSAQTLPSPEWAAQVAYLGQWRSGDRLARLDGWWRERRLPGDAEPYQAYRAWRKQYLHLSNWWRNLQDQMVLRLREQYRCFAADVARNYDTVIIEAFNIRQTVRTPAPESDAIVTAANSYRQRVSPAMFRGCLLNALAREGVTVVKLPAEYTTRRCHVCAELGLENLEEWDQTELRHTCNRGHSWDQDFNAAANLLLASGRVMTASPV
jgi:hypothetical protein